MTEEEAIAWATARHPPETMDRLHRFAAMVADENSRQNLVAPATLATIWSRHIVDSLQLVPLGRSTGPWLDIGTGGGFPGLVVAIVGTVPIVLAEPRRRRVDFLRRAADELGCEEVEVFAGKVETLAMRAATISARAVGSIENLLRAAGHCATVGTRWLLPRGSIDRADLEAAMVRHSMMFHVEQSITRRESSIVILEAK